MGPTGKTRVAQIHLTRRCNLRCLHCYSSSSPKESETLDIENLKRSLNFLADEGYNWISLSGGEPLLYPELATLLNHARKLKMKVALVSNGMLLTDTKLNELANNIDLLVLSIDGRPDSHNKMRNHDRAYEILVSRLPSIRKSGIPYGFIFTLTQHNLDELPWVAEFALKSGGKLLQIHPLGNTGNAMTQLPGKSPDAIEASYAWVLSQELQKNVGDQLAIQLDYMYSEVIKENPALIYAQPFDDYQHHALSELISPLIIEPDGEMVPFQFGFPRGYSLGNINQHDIVQQIKTWQAQQYPNLQRVCQTLLGDIQQAPEPYFVNIYQELIQRALYTSDTFSRAVGDHK